MGKKIGRPSKLNSQKMDEICAQIAQGKSLVGILKRNPSRYPTYTNVMAALRKNEDFRQKYAKAKEEQADYLAEEILEIADDSTRDCYEDDDGEHKVDHEHIARSRLRVDTRKWIAGKLKPKKYGESLKLGNDPDNPFPGVIMYPEKKKEGES